VLQPPPVDHQEALTEYPWDNEDSFDRLDEAAIGHFPMGDDNNPSGAPNNQAWINSESANNAALKFGIRFTTQQYHKTKLLKILSDANALHYPIVRPPLL
jgi:hypothetical protein